MKNFVSVSTGAARYQDISLNPQKLAGMCAKLKCCLNYEVDSYIEAGRKLPSREVVLQTMDGDHFLFKTDILAGLVTYSTDKRLAANLVTITAQRALEIVEMNRRGEKPDSLNDGDEHIAENHQVDLLAGESLTRFDKAKKKKKQKSRGNKEAKAANANNQQPANNQQGGNQQATAENRKQRRAEGKPQRQEGKPQQPRQEGKPQRQEGKPQQRRDNKPQRDVKPQLPDANGDQQKPQDDRQRQRGPKQQRNGGNGNGGQRRRQGKPDSPQQPKQEKANDGGNQ